MYQIAVLLLHHRTATPTRSVSEVQQKKPGILVTPGLLNLGYLPVSQATTKGAHHPRVPLPIRPVTFQIARHDDLLGACRLRLYEKDAIGAGRFTRFSRID